MSPAALAALGIVGLALFMRSRASAAGGGAEETPLPGAAALAAEAPEGLQPPAPVGELPWPYLGRSAGGPEATGQFAGAAHVWMPPPGAEAAIPEQDRGLRAFYLASNRWKTWDTRYHAFRDGRIVRLDLDGSALADGAGLTVPVSVDRSPVALSRWQKQIRNVQLSGSEPRALASASVNAGNVGPAGLSAELEAWWGLQRRRHPRWRIGSRYLCPIMSVPEMGYRYAPGSALMYITAAEAPELARLGLIVGAGTPWVVADAEDIGGAWALAKTGSRWLSQTTSRAMCDYMLGFSRTAIPLSAGNEPVRFWDGSVLVGPSGALSGYGDFVPAEARVVFWRTVPGSGSAYRSPDPVQAHGFPEYIAPASWSRGDVR